MKLHTTFRFRGLLQGKLACSFQARSEIGIATSPAMTHVYKIKHFCDVKQTKQHCEEQNPKKRAKFVGANEFQWKHFEDIIEAVHVRATFTYFRCQECMMAARTEYGLRGPATCCHM